MTMMVACERVWACSPSLYVTQSAKQTQPTFQIEKFLFLPRLLNLLLLFLFWLIFGCPFLAFRVPLLSHTAVYAHIHTDKLHSQYPWNSEPPQYIFSSCEYLSLMEIELLCTFYGIMRVYSTNVWQASRIEWAIKYTPWDVLTHCTQYTLTHISHTMRIRVKAQHKSVRK